MGAVAVENFKTEHQEMSSKHTASSSGNKLPPKRAALPRGIFQLQVSPGGNELLTVDVLDEAGGAGHIVHFELK